MQNCWVRRTNVSNFPHRSLGRVYCPQLHVSAVQTLYMLHNNNTGSTPAFWSSPRHQAKLQDARHVIHIHNNEITETITCKTAYKPFCFCSFEESCENNICLHFCSWYSCTNVETLLVPGMLGTSTGAKITEFSAA